MTKCAGCGHAVKFHDPIYGCSIMLNDDDQCLCGRTWDGSSVAPLSSESRAPQKVNDLLTRYLTAGDIAWTKQGQSLDDMFKRLTGRKLLQDFADWADVMSAAQPSGDSTQPH